MPSQLDCSYIAPQTPVLEADLPKQAPFADEPVLEELGLWTELQTEGVTLAVSWQGSGWCQR